MMFEHRRHAGAELARALRSLPPDALVLGVPRGGVIVAREVADALGLGLDVAIAHKLGAPGNPELAIGAVGPDGQTVLDRSVISLIGEVPSRHLEREVERQTAEIRRRMLLYRGSRAPLDVKGRVCVVIDDGIATGSTVRAAALWVRAHGAARTIVAVPVAPTDAAARLRDETDEFVALATPADFRAVGQFYRSFEQVTDESVADALAHPSGAR